MILEVEILLNEPSEEFILFSQLFAARFFLCRFL